MHTIKSHISTDPTTPAQPIALINPDRLSHVTNLSRGRHKPGNEMCPMEAVAYIAREPWSDNPQCTSHTIARFIRSWGDALPDDATRNRLLLPLLPKIINTRGSPQLELQRAMMAAEWLIRTHAVAWLRLAKLDTQAATLAWLRPITHLTQAASLLPTLNKVREQTNAAREATKLNAWIEALEAARNTAFIAAGDTAGDAARRVATAIDAGNAGGAAAGNTAGHAAKNAVAWAFAWLNAADAGWAISWDAAWISASRGTPEALKLTTTNLQTSAIALIERMAALQNSADHVSSDANTHVEATS